MNQSAKEMLHDIKEGIYLAKSLSLDGVSDWVVYEDLCSPHLVYDLINELTFFMDNSSTLYMASSKGSQLIATIETLQLIKSKWFVIEQFFTTDTVNLTDDEFDSIIDLMINVINVL